jgi:hypothetical protein
MKEKMLARFFLALSSGGSPDYSSELLSESTHGPAMHGGGHHCAILHDTSSEYSHASAPPSK